MRFLAAWVLSLLPLFAAINLGFFNTTAEVGLKKDQFMRIVISDNEEKRVLAFRWTLFHNKGLVTHTNYNGHPMQHLLYKRFREDTIKIDIALRDGEEARYHPYLLITFLGYDYTTKKANFEIQHKDLQEQTRIVIEEGK